MTTKKLPRSGSMTDDPADLSTSVFTPMGPGPGSIVGDLVARSGDPQAGTLVPRYGTEGLCPECQQLLLSRVPGVHPDVDSGRVHNFDPAIDAPGQDQMDIIGDEELDSGRAEQEFAARSARHLPGTWPRDDAVLVDARDIREGRYGPR